MSSDNMVMTPLQGVKLNEYIRAYMAVTAQTRKADLAHFLENGQNMPNQLLETALRGAIFQASA